MLSTKPYLIRAFYEWILDSECTPFIVIDVNIPRCNVPTEHIENGEIVFNISPDAVRDLKVGNEMLEFRASFSGVIRIVSAPVQAILAIYADENGQGMFFDTEDEGANAGMSGWTEEGSAALQQSEPYTQEKKKPSHLRLVE